MAAVNVRMNPFGVIGAIFVMICLWWYLFGLPLSSREEQRVSMKELLTVSIELAKRGGDSVYAIRTGGSLGQKVKGKTAEGAKEMLTQGDMESHRAIMYGMLKAFPGLRVISEEHETAPISLERVKDVTRKLAEVERLIQSDQQIPVSDIAVWIDPLDATQEYTENLTQYVTTMVCVAIKGEPTIGVIHRPFEKETVWAWAGYGHSENLKKSKEKKIDENDQTKIIVSRSHKGEVEEVAKKAFGEKTIVVPAGGAGYKTLALVKGEVDAYVHVTLIKKWDICAGNAILSALDSRMTDLKGNTIDYSASGNAKNEHGLLATLYNHDTYVRKLEGIMDNTKKKEKRSDSMNR
ncbi:inositol monophosphatase 3-like [Liolophura sinensis]|uniref:inositol monophosphatase 3-like n=1 Tax=Liolophura sinensis TaxID=3198878 RepID=UPI003158ED08